MHETLATSAFRKASREVLEYLHANLGFSLWMVTRTKGDDWVVLAAEDHGYSVEEGKVFRWADSFCSRMVRGEGPFIAPRSTDIPAYASAPIGRQVCIGSYIGLPLRQSDGELFGTLCAVDPFPKPDEIVDELPQIVQFARLLEIILECESKAVAEARRAERAEALALTDSLTGLFNRGGWDELLKAEETRCMQYAHPAVILSLDLDELKFTNDNFGHQAGDLLLQNTARLLVDSLRKDDIVARVGGDEFAVLAIECKEDGEAKICRRLSRVLAEKDIAASIGSCSRQATSTLAESWQLADAAMYEEKRKRKSSLLH